jgi:hypothetical protein
MKRGLEEVLWLGLLVMSAVLWLFAIYLMLNN